MTCICRNHGSLVIGMLLFLVSFGCLAIFAGGPVKVTVLASRQGANGQPPSALRTATRPLEQIIPESVAASDSSGTESLATSFSSGYGGPSSAHMSVMSRRLTNWMRTCLGLLVLLGTALASLPRLLQRQPSTSSLTTASPTSAGTFSPEFETVVPTGVTGVEGVYYAPESDLARRVLKAIPSLAQWTQWYEVPFWARDGHIHTIVASTRRRAPAVVYHRTFLRCPSGGTVTMDQLVDVLPLRARSNEKAVTFINTPPDEWIEQQRGRPFLLMVSGLGGGSQDTYVRSMAVAAMRRGWRVGVVNMRGCGGSPITSPRFFSAHRGSTDDVRLAVAHLRECVLSPGAPIAAVGWSNGASIINNYLAEQESSHPKPEYRLDAAATLGCPLNMPIASHNFKKWFNRRVYDRAITRSLLDKLAPALHLFQGKEVDTWDGGKCTVDVERLMLSSTIEEIDEHLTRRVFGFPSVAEYYRQASSHQRLPHIRVPTLIVNALDDPVAPGEGIAYDEVANNPNLLLAVTAHGGHLGWCEKADPTDGSKWIEDVSLSFLEVALGR